MSVAVRILVFAGSARKASFNKKLAAHAGELIAARGAEVTVIDLADYPLPLYDGDLEAAEGLPDNARELKRLFIDHDGFFISSPEYNSSLTPLLKNTIDWVSRREEGDAGPLVAYRGKVAALAAASPGRLGGMRMLPVLRMLLSNVGVHVVPQQVSVASAGEAFAEDGSLKEDAGGKLLANAVGALVDTAAALAKH